MTRWQGTADLRSAPLREAQRNGVSPRSRMTPVSARTPAGKDDALARERRPPVGTAAQSAAKVVYHAVARMTFNAEVSTERRTTPELGVLAAARLRRAVPTRGRRSRACASLRPVAWSREANHPRTRGSFPAARLRRAVPTRGRRSRACALLSMVAWSREANHPRTRGPSLPPAYGGLCRPEVGVPVPARRSARWRGAERRTTLELASLPPAAVRRSSRTPSSGTAPCPVHTKKPGPVAGVTGSGDCRSPRGPGRW